MRPSSILTVILTMLFFMNSIVAENKHKCATMESLTHLKNKYPSTVNDMAKLEQQTQEWIAQNKDVKQLEEVITIPVVVHIVYSNTVGNISDAQIYSQLDILNEDFRRTNADALNTPNVFLDRAADIEIEFCLATKDPNGFPTTGINRKSTNKTTFDISQNEVKFSNQGGVDAWPTDRYLNIWVCNNLRSDGLSGVLGYAQFPETGSAQTDGVVIIHSAFGNTGTVEFPYTEGRTTTHEVGHWLNLRHIWGDGNCNQDDFVDDTPRSNTPNYGCNTNLNNCTNESPDLNDMVQNYMDYSNDACQNMFTLGQKARMRALFAFPTSARYSLTQSDACEIVSVGDNDVIVNQVLSPFGVNNCTTIEPIVDFTNFGTNDLYFVTVNYSIDNGPIKSYSYFPVEPVASFATIQITLPAISIPDGGIVHTLNVSFVDPNGSTDHSAENNDIVVDFGTVGNPVGLSLPVQESFETPLPTDWAINGNFAINTETGVDGEQCFFINSNTSTTGTKNEFTLPDVDLGEVSNGKLYFYTAHALTNDNSQADVVEVLVSVNCGESYETIYTTTGNDLVSGAATTGNFIPANNAWKEHKVDLVAYSQVPNLSIMFRQTQGTGNNLYIDNINIVDGSVGITNNFIAPKSIQAYPNPAVTNTQLSFNSPKATSLQVQLIDNVGRIVSNQTIQAKQGENKVTVEVANLSAGIYIINLNQDEVYATTKLVVVK